MAKQPVDKHSFVQVFGKTEDTLQENIVALFELMNRPGMAFSTPGERKRFKEAYDVIKNADIVVDEAKVKIVANAQDARKIALALSVPNAEGELVAPAVEDVLDASKLPTIILEYATQMDTFKQTMENIRVMREGKIAELEAEKVKTAEDMAELAKEVQATKRTATELLERNQALTAENTALTEQNEDLYNQANYVTRSGKAVPAKKANKITIVVAALLLITTLASAAVGISKGVQTGKLKTENTKLKNDYAIVYALNEEQQKTIAGLLEENELLEGENKTLESLNEALEIKVEDLNDQVEDLKEDIEDLNDQIEDHKTRFQNVVEKAQQAGVIVPDDVNIEDLFDAIMESTENGTSDDVKKVYAYLLECMADYGVSKQDITDENGNYTSDKINKEVKHIFDTAIVNAQTLANNEEIIIDALDGTGKSRADFKNQTEALKFVIENDDKQIKELQEEVDKKEKIIGEKNQEIDKLEETIETLEETIEYLENNGGGTDNSELVEELRKQLAEEKAKTARLTERVNSLSSQLSSTKEALNTAIEERDAAIEDAEDARNDATVAENAYNTLLSSYNTTMAENERLKAENEELKKNQGGSSTQNPSQAPSTDNNSGNVNVGDVDKEDENVNPGQEDKDKVNTPDGELGDE